AGESVARRASGFGLPAVVVDGQDVVAVHEAVSAARDRALAGEGPTFVEARTYRYEGHNVGDTQNYRERTEVSDWRRERDPNEKIFVLGTDILRRGGHFAQVLGLGERFGAERIRDTPISEAAMVAAGVGSAIGGMRPVVDLNFQDFAFGAMDELCNQAAKIHY